MSTVGRLKEGTLMIAGSINERLPVIQNGLVAHFPFDGRGGAFDSIGGYDPLTPVNSNMNLIELCNLDWKDVSNWTRHTQTGSISWDETEQAIKVTNGWWGYFNQWFKIDTSKKWFIEAQVKRESGTGTFYLGDIAYNIDKSTTGISQKPGTHEYWGASGNAPGSNWTLYKNSAIGGVPRTGDNTTVSDRTTWYTGTEWIRFMFIANYNEQIGTTYIKDLKLYYIDTDTSNATFTYDGIAIEESTTNIIAADYDTTFESFANGNTVGFSNQLGTGSILEVSTDRAYEGFKSFKIKRGIGSSGRCYRTKAVSISQYFTVSAWVYSLKPGTYLHLEMTGGDYNWAVPYTKNTHTGNGWEKLWARINAPTTSVTTGYYFIYPVHNDPIYVDNIQVENKSFNTSHTSNSRGNGSIKFPLHFSNNMTFSFKHRSYMPLSSQPGQGASPNIFELGNYYSNASITLWCWTGAIRTYIKGDTGTSWQTVPTHVTLSDSDWMKEHTWTLVFSGTSGWDTYKVYMDGNLLTTTTLNPAITTINGGFYALGVYGGTYPNATYKDLSVYNRALSDSEVYKLANPSFSFKKDGTLFVNKLMEVPPIIPSNTVYCPLDYDSLDIYKLFNADDVTGVTYPNGKAWVNVGNKLHFNLNRDLGWDWNSNWTIIYWKYPIRTASSNLTGYNIDSIGCGSNSVGGGYIWWGKSTGSDSIANSSPSTFLPNDFFNNWHMVSARKSGSNITFTHWGIGRQNYVRNYPIGTIATNYYVTQYGYDLKLGGWDNVNSGDSYFRDLMLIQSALTDVEIESIFNKKMRSKNGTLLVSNQLIEEGL